jgi:hypothetical protein
MRKGRSLRYSATIPGSVAFRVNAGEGVRGRYVTAMTYRIWAFRGRGYDRSRSVIRRLGERPEAVDVAPQAGPLSRVLAAARGRAAEGSAGVAESGRDGPGAGPEGEGEDGRRERLGRLEHPCLRRL